MHGHTYIYSVREPRGHEVGKYGSRISASIYTTRTNARAHAHEHTHTRTLTLSHTHLYSVGETGRHELGKVRQPHESKLHEHPVVQVRELLGHLHSNLRVLHNRVERVGYRRLCLWCEKQAQE